MRQLLVPTVQTVQQIVEILQVPFLGPVLGSPLLCIDRCVACVPVDKFQQGNSGSASFQFIDRVVASLWIETGTLGKTVEIPQVQFLDQVFADCAYWYIDKAVDVPVIS